MSGFDLSDYVTVDERIRLFIDKHPDGTLQGEGEFVRDDVNNIVGYVYKALAFRSPEDPRPGVGTAFEPIPGKTPYTKDSEVMNAETSAWGRAIVAAGIPSRKIASQEEVRNRQDAPPTDGRPDSQAKETGKKAKLLNELTDCVNLLNEKVERADGSWKAYYANFAKEHYDGKLPSELTIAQLETVVADAKKHVAFATSDVPF